MRIVKAWQEGRRRKAKASARFGTHLTQLAHLLGKLERRQHDRHPSVAHRDCVAQSALIARAKPVSANDDRGMWLLRWLWV